MLRQAKKSGSIARISPVCGYLRQYLKYQTIAAINATTSKNVNGKDDLTFTKPLDTRVIKPIPLGNIKSVIGEVIEANHS